MILDRVREREREGKKRELVNRLNVAIETFAYKSCNAADWIPPAVSEPD